MCRYSWFYYSIHYLCSESDTVYHGIRSKILCTGTATSNTACSVCTSTYIESDTLYRRIRYKALCGFNISFSISLHDTVDHYTRMKIVCTGIVGFNVK